MSIVITSSIRQFGFLHTLLHTSKEHLLDPIYCMEQVCGAVIGKYSVKTDLTETSSLPHVFFMTVI